jgi:hypothetical protein
MAGSVLKEEVKDILGKGGAGGAWGEVKTDPDKPPHHTEAVWF